LAAASLVLVDGLGLCLLSQFEHVCSMRTSIIINTYLLITILFDIAQIRTVWVEDAPKSNTCVFTVTAEVRFLVAIIEATEKKKILLDRYRETSSEVTSWVSAVLFSGGYTAFVLIQGHTKVQLTPATAFTTLSLAGLLLIPFNTLLRAIPQVKSALACSRGFRSSLNLPLDSPTFVTFHAFLGFH
jgi:hypothetical protein